MLETKKKKKKKKGGLGEENGREGVLHSENYAGGFAVAHNVVVYLYEY